jgi:CheY-like chemotaxis protein
MSNRPNVALIDINLEGGHEGIEVARRLRERCDVPIVFVTGCTDTGSPAMEPEEAPVPPVRGFFFRCAIAPLKLISDKLLALNFCILGGHRAFSTHATDTTDAAYLCRPSGPCRHPSLRPH